MDMQETALALADARQASARAFRDVEVARKLLADAERNAQTCAVTVCELEASMLRAWRTEVGTVPRKSKPLTLDSARYTMSDVRI